MDIAPSQLTHRELYGTLLNVVAPRPIAWVSSLSASGIANLAPFSFFNVVCVNPPLLGFSPSHRAPRKSETGSSGVEPKDTLRNIRETGEFVVNIVTYELTEAMNLTSGDYEASASEFDVARLASAPSRLVRPPRVAASPASMECKLHQILDFNPGPEGGALVIGQVVSIHVEAEYLKEGRVDRDSLDLIGRMGGLQYTRTKERFDLARPKVE